MEIFTEEFLQNQRNWLLKRRESKTNILREGGERALSHSWSDITRINFAIKRIDEGQYGLCPNCGAGIEVKRLKSIPETPFCSFCAGLKEREREYKTKQNKPVH